MLRWWLNRILYAVAIVLPLTVAIASAVLTLAGKLHIDQGTGLTLVAVVVTASAPAVRWLRRRQAEESKHQAELKQLVYFLGLVGAVDPELLGVAPSQVEDRSYLRRPRTDELIRSSLLTQRFVVIVGESAAGKSRAAIEAVRDLWPNHDLIGPLRTGLRRQGLQRIVELTRSRRSPMILWLDDLDQYLAGGALTVEMLNKWATDDRRVTILATMETLRWANWRFPSEPRSDPTKSGALSSTELQIVDEVGKEAALVLSHATTVDLPRRLETAAERSEATRRFGAQDWTALGLGEVLAAGPEMLTKLRGGQGSHPWGIAIAEAAADWRGAGVGRPISQSELRELSKLYLHRWSTQSEDFESGLGWLTGPIKPGSRIRILSHRFVSLGDEPHYEIHDYVASSLEHAGRTVSDSVWYWLLNCESIGPDEFMRIGSTAESKRKAAVAVAAYDKVFERYGDTTELVVQQQVARAMGRKGSLLDQQAKPDAAIAIYDLVDERYGDATDRGLREEVEAALLNKGFVLYRQGQVEAAIAAWRAVEERYGQASEPELHTRVAAAMCAAATALAGKGEPDSALAIFRDIEERYSLMAAPFDQHSVAMAGVGKGLVLAALGQVDAAMATWETVLERYGGRAPFLFGDAVAMALAGKAKVLSVQGHTAEAIAVYDLLDERYRSAVERGVRRQVAMALFDKGRALIECGQPDAAIAVFDLVDERYGQEAELDLPAVAKASVEGEVPMGRDGQSDAAMMVSMAVAEWYRATPADWQLRAIAANAQVAKATLLEAERQGEAAIAVYDHVEERYGHCREIELQAIVVKALVRKGIAMADAGLTEAAMSVWKQVENRYGEASETQLREEVASALLGQGIVLRQQGQAEAAMAIFDRVEKCYGDAPEARLRGTVALALVGKGNSLADQGMTEAAIAVYELVDERYADSVDASLHESVGRALVCKGKVLSALGKPEAALAMFDLVEERYGEVPEAGCREQVVGALVAKGEVLLGQGDSDAALTVWQEVEKRYGDAPEPKVRAIISDMRARLNALDTGDR